MCTDTLFLAAISTTDDPVQPAREDNIVTAAIGAVVGIVIIVMVILLTVIMIVVLMIINKGRKKEPTYSLPGELLASSFDLV